MGERGGKEEEGDLVSVRRGMCRGGKVETGCGGESTRGRGGGDTRTHEIIVGLDYNCRDGVWVLFEGVCVCFCCMYTVYLHCACNCLRVNMYTLISRGPPADAADR